MCNSFDKEPIKALLFLQLQVLQFRLHQTQFWCTATLEKWIYWRIRSTRATLQSFQLLFALGERQDQLSLIKRQKSNYLQKQVCTACLSNYHSNATIIVSSSCIGPPILGIVYKNVWFGGLAQQTTDLSPVAPAVASSSIENSTNEVLMRSNIDELDLAEDTSHTTTTSIPSTAEPLNQKRKRGRPRKTPLISPLPNSSTSSSNSKEIVQEEEQTIISDTVAPLIRKSQRRRPSKAHKVAINSTPTLSTSTTNNEDEEIDCLIDMDEEEEETNREQQRKAEDAFKVNCFNVVMDCLITQMSSRFTSSRDIAARFSFLWNFDLNLAIAQKAASDLAAFYNKDLTSAFEEQFNLLRRSARMFLKPGSSFIPPLDLLNSIFKAEMQNAMPEICIALRMFLCFFVTVAEGERSFSTLGKIKTCFRSTMGQTRLNSLGMLSIESELASALDFDEIIDAFAQKAARKIDLISRVPAPPPDQSQP